MATTEKLMPRWFYRSPGPEQYVFILMREDMMAIWVEHYQTQIIDHEGFHQRKSMQAGTAYAMWRWRAMK